MTHLHSARIGSLARMFMLFAFPMLLAQSSRASGEFLTVDWSAAPEAETEAREALRLGDEWAPLVERLVFGQRVDAHRRIDVRFNGDARYGDPPRYRTPHVTGAGLVNLYQYGPSHMAAFPHELVHAVLRREGIRYGGFDEEGFAGYGGWQLRPSLPGFPVYGHPLEIVVGHWVSTGNAIPLTTLRPRHRELNLKCSFQSYAFRTAFFIHLGEVHGADAMRTFVHNMGRDDSYTKAFGESLDALEAEWLEHTIAAFEARTDRQQLIDSYLSQPAVANAYVCRPGTDF